MENPCREKNDAGEKEDQTMKPHVLPRSQIRNMELQSHCMMHMMGCLLMPKEKASF